MIEVNKQGEVWVFAEQEAAALSEVPLELLSKARELAGQLGVQTAAALLGGDCRALADELIAHGADKVYLASDPRLADYQTNPYAKVLGEMVATHRPQIVIYGATVIGRDLAPRVASSMRCGLTADCTDLQIGDHEDKIAKKTYRNLLYQVRPAFGGNIIATIVNPQRWPQMATVREGVMPLGEPDPKRSGEVIPVEVHLEPGDLVLRIVERHLEAKSVNLKAARTIVAGGAGVGSKDNFRPLFELAGVLGGAVAGSRAAVDAGYIGKDHQVGQTGVTVRPVLYIAAGISGAVQHLAGMDQSGKILAINSDPDAPIFQAAHYAVVGDLNQVIPMITKAVKARV